MRSRELRTLPLAQLDLTAGRAEVVGKGTRPRAVLLPEGLVAVLKVQPQPRCTRGCPRATSCSSTPAGTGTIRHTKNRAGCASAARSRSSPGSAPACPDGTTRTSPGTAPTPTELVRAGVDIHVVQRLLGHRWIRSTVGYTHLVLDDLGDTVRSRVGLISC